MEDYEAFAQLSKVGPIAYLDTELAEVREHGGPRLTDVEELQHLDARIRVLERVWGPDAALVTRAKRALRSRVARGLAARGALRRAGDLLRAGVARVRGG